jgi:hypothetical protein
MRRGGFRRGDTLKSVPHKPLRYSAVSFGAHASSVSPHEAGARTSLSHPPGHGPGVNPPEMASCTFLILSAALGFCYSPSVVLG